MPTLRYRANIPGRLCTDQMLTCCQSINHAAPPDSSNWVEFNGETKFQRVLEPCLQAVAIQP